LTPQPDIVRVDADLILRGRRRMIAAPGAREEEGNVA
jgi:hypothetical protein